MSSFYTLVLKLFSTIDNNQLSLIYFIFLCHILFVYIQSLFADQLINIEIELLIRRESIYQRGIFYFAILRVNLNCATTIAFRPMMSFVSLFYSSRPSICI